jgi:hypothetical protein
MDSLQIRDLNGVKIKDSLVLSNDHKSNRIGSIEFIILSISSGGQNIVKPPNKLFLKRNKLYRINQNGTLDLRKLKAFWSDNKFKTYFLKENE